MITKEAVLNALSTVMDPDLHQDLVTLNMIENIQIDEDKVSFSIVLTTPSCPLKGKIEADARKAVLTMTKAEEVDIRMTAKVKNSKTIDLGDNCFRHVIAVGSGKGGVGKSTVSLNIALALANDGAKVGLLDADIYGPNIPRMLGIDHLPDIADDKKLRPAEIHGLKVVSIGFMVQPGQPLIWRGPMLHSAIQQFITDFEWGDLDYLVVDLPPGTGDVQLSLAQSIPISGAVIVTTMPAELWAWSKNSRFPCSALSKTCLISPCRMEANCTYLVKMAVAAWRTRWAQDCLGASPSILELVWVGILALR
jgi:ATP-binding protein involved in chromosome partitioning